MQMGSTDKVNFNAVLRRAWDMLGLGRFNWIIPALNNPIFEEVILFKSTYHPTASGLYVFNRHTEVHEPEKTMVTVPVPPQGGPAPAAVTQRMEKLQTMLSPTETNFMLGMDFGMFVAQATALILIELRIEHSAYIEEAYLQYKNSIDALYF